MDYGHEQSEKELKELEELIRKEYSQASKELQAKWENYMQAFARKDQAKRKLLEEKKIDEKEYIRWRTGQIAVGARWKDMQENIAEDLLHTNEMAVAIINGRTPAIYALNHNFGTFEGETLSGIKTNYTLYNRATVARLLRDNPNLLPRPKVDVAKDLKWNQQHIQSAVLQGILQGESVEEIAKRMQTVTDMNYRSAIRNARTAVTGAQNAGRIDSYIRLKSKGLDIKKVWLATLDGRTRHSHRQLDGEQADPEEKFSNGCMYPADPDGRPEEVYNCRCTLVAQFEGLEKMVDGTKDRYTEKLDGKSYEEWKTEQKQPEPEKKSEPSKFVQLTAQLGADYVANIDRMLDEVPEPFVADAYRKFAEDFNVIDPNYQGGAKYSLLDQGIFMNAERVAKGYDIHKPYQTLFHEMGHQMDNLIIGKWKVNGISRVYNNGELYKNIMVDWEKYRYKAIIKHYQDLGWPYKSDTTLLEDFATISGRTKKLLKEINSGNITLTEALDQLTVRDWNKIARKFSARNLNELAYKALRWDYIKSVKDLSAWASVSDIAQGCLNWREGPLGCGHRRGYHNERTTPMEFFAEVLDGVVANRESYELLKEIFPTAVETVFKILEVYGK